MTFSVALLVLSLFATISITRCIPQVTYREENSEHLQESDRKIEWDLATVTSQGLKGQELAAKSFHGIKAELVHKDHYLRAPRGSSHLSAKDRTDRDLHSSMRRAAVLQSRHGRLLADSSSPPTFLSNMSLAWNEAEYVMTISLGTPAQNYVAVADTGSDLVWLQCVPCNQCARQADNPFDPKLSSSYKNLTCSDTPCQKFTGYPQLNPNCNTSPSSSCNYFYAYGDGTNTTGDFLTDIIHLQTIGGNVTDSPNFAFGCSHTVSSESGLLSGTVNGLVGLGRGEISFPSQLGSNFGKIFSYCLVSAKEGFSKTSPLLFGEAALSNSTGLRFTPVLYENTTFYFVGLEGISVGGQQLNVPSSLFAFNGTDGGTIFDSGTTYTQLQSQALDALANFLIANLSFPTVEDPTSGLEFCWLIVGVSDDELANSIPTITFRFTDADYEFSYENAFIRQHLITCLAISRAGVFGSQTIIGNHQQRNKHVVYDGANKRIGFVTRDCAASGSGSSISNFSTSSPSSATGSRDQLKSVVTYVLLLPIVTLTVVHGIYFPSVLGFSM